MLRYSVVNFIAHYCRQPVYFFNFSGSIFKVCNRFCSHSYIFESRS